MQKKIPAELQIDILRRLPLARFIVRFRCVSKSWCALLSDPSFLRHKLFFVVDNSEHSSSPPPLTMMINHSFDGIPVTQSVYSLHSCDTLEPRLEEADLPFGFRDYSIAGCCNGLLCFQKLPRWPETNINLVLWNPTTSETKAVPPPSSTLFDRTHHQQRQQHDVMHHHALGFGFDPEANDYKIMIIGRRERFRRLGNGICVEVYSLRNDSWSKIDRTGRRFVHAWSSLPVLPYPQFPPCYEGKLYWWSNTYSQQGETKTSFVSFDLSREVFRAVDVANPAANKNWTVRSLLFVSPTNGEDSLVAVCSTDNRGSFEVWALLELRVPESWTKLFAIPRATAEFQSFFGVSRNFVFYYYDVGIDQILVAYHLATGEVFELAVPRTKPKPHHVMDHVPSLVSLT